MFAADKPAVSYGWAGTVEAVTKLPTEARLDAMTTRHYQLDQQRPTQTQLQAWQDTAAVLDKALNQPHQRL